MKLYYVEYHALDYGASRRWASSKREAAKLRREAVEEGADRKSVSISEANIKMTKPGVLAFLNNWATSGEESG